MCVKEPERVQMCAGLGTFPSSGVGARACALVYLGGFSLMYTRVLPACVLSCVCLRECVFVSVWLCEGACVSQSVTLCVCACARLCTGQNVCAFVGMAMRVCMSVYAHTFLDL